MSPDEGRRYPVYMPPTSRTWWLRSGPYRRFAAREITSMFAAIFSGLMIAFLPKEKVLFQADFTLPTPGQPPNDHVKALFPILEKLNLTFDRYIPVHTSATPQTKADLWKAMGK